MMAHLTKLAMYYMFAKEVSMEEFIKIERLSMLFEEYGKEVSKIRISIFFLKLRHSWHHWLQLIFPGFGHNASTSDDKWKAS